MKNFPRLFLFLLVLNKLLIAFPGTVQDSISLSFRFATGLTFDGAALWLADHKADVLACINPVNGEVIRTIPSPGFWPAGLE